MTAASVGRALERARDWLVAQDAPEAVIVAHEAGAAGDDADARRWIRRILDRQGPGGAWDGDVVRTAGALMTLAEIRSAASLREQDPAIGVALDWLRARRGAPGAWSDGCSEERHALGLCHHFLGGFLSPGPPEVPQLEAPLRSGARAVGDAEVRFVASAVALRCLLVWAQPARDARLHLEGLRHVVGLWPEQPPAGLGIVSLLAAIHALLRSGAPEDRAAAEQGLRVVAGKQRGDGSWVETDPFQALEVFTGSESGGADWERAHRALWHGARLLISTQKSDGSWGGDDDAPRRALIAWRALRRLEPTSPA